MNRYSILVDNFNECIECGTTRDIHKHEVFFGTANRKLSIKYGLVVPLCAYHHNMSNKGVHNNRKLDIELKQMAQRRFNVVYPDLDFIKIFGKSWL